MKSTLITFLFLQLGLNLFGEEQTRLLRFPAVHGNQVVFTYAGDLYTVSRTGGTARRMTSHVGHEIFPRFSPDGKHIAFTGQYDGNTEVYVIPSTGGVPKRLTYTATLSRDDLADRMGPNNIVMTWTPDGENIIYRSRKQSFNSFKGALYSVPLTGGLSEEIPLSTAGFCSYSSDGSQLAFNRVFREFRTWKYYEGGMADDIWLFNFDNKKTVNITHNDHQDIFPMWKGHKIFFLSDRDRIMNVFVYDTTAKTVRKVTRFEEYDVKFPSIGQDYLIFENGGYLYSLHLETEKIEQIPVCIKNDLIYARDRWKDASKLIRSAGLSPEGKRIVFSARGDIFTVPSEEGITKNITSSSGIHERNASWSPDGKHIAYISDASGEFEIYLKANKPGANPVQLTKNADTYKFKISWSPDSKKIAWNDRKYRLKYIDIETNEEVEVFTSEHGVINYFDWSPDSKWLVFDRLSTNRFNYISLYNLDKKNIVNVTDDWYNSYRPIFSDNGKYLVFASDREFDPVYSQTEWNHAYTDMAKIFITLLSADTPSPFSPKNDKVKSGTGEDEKDDSQNQEEQEHVRIDINGLYARTISLPVSGSRYYSLNTAGNKIYYAERPESGNQQLKMYDLDKQKEVELGNNMNYTLSYDKKKMLVLKGSGWYVIDTPVSSISLSNSVDLGDMKVWVNLQKEWQQIFDESWRQMRDFFYAPNMHGVDWQAMHDKYNGLIPYVKHRDDLTYVIGELIGELNVGHAYVLSGEREQAERIKTGLLGAKISKHTSGYIRIDSILPGNNWNHELHSPLTDVGVDIDQGDFIISIDDKSVKNVNNPYSLLVGKAGKTVKIETNNLPREKGAKESLIVPVSDESALYYYNWVQNNIRKVSDATGGKVGYIHIPDMLTNGLNEFAKYFYPQVNKQAVIIDDRGNGGGNVSPMIIERLNRDIIRANMRRNLDYGTPVPFSQIIGPKVMLVDNYSASDGDLFAHAFKRLNMGTVIGTRTWGGIVGISSSLPLIDGGTLRRPEFTSYDAETGEWLIEGYGVEPDIKIDNDPYREYKGKDEQLEKAIEIIIKQLDDFEGLPDIPPFPVK